jgi:hypothetical protein
MLPRSHQYFVGRQLDSLTLVKPLVCAQIVPAAEPEISVIAQRAEQKFAKPMPRRAIVIGDRDMQCIAV